MKLKRIIAIILLVIILSFAGCNGGGSGEPNNNDSISASEPSGDGAGGGLIGGSDENSRENYKDSLPDDLDFGGAEYRVLCREDDDYNYEFIAEEIGEVVNDALYRRQMAVENRLNVKIIPIKKPGDWNEQNVFLSAMRNSINSGSDDYEIVASYAYYTTPLALDGNFVNLAEFPYIDYEKPWWPDSITKNLKIANKLHFITGEYTLTLLRGINCIFFNKTIAQNYAFPSFYQIVLDGDWTFDKYSEIAKSVSQDLNGDGIFGKEDLYGHLSLSFDVYLSAFQLPLTETETDGTLKLAAYNEKFVSAYNKLYEFWNDAASYPIKLFDDTDWVWGRHIFTNDQAMFNGGFLKWSEIFRDMTSDYGILPYPKYDKSQADYYTHPHNDHSLLCVPVTAVPGRYAMIGAVTEALAAEGYRTVTPAYFEVALKNKYNRDNESSQMLDILVAGSTLTPGTLYSGSLNGVNQLLNQIHGGTSDITSYYDKNSGAYEKAFANFNEKFLRLD